MREDSVRDFRLARRGDKDAFIRLIRRLEISLYQIAHAILADDRQCADAIQNTIVKAYERVTNIDQKETFEPWMMRMLVEECHRLRASRDKIIPLDKAREPAKESGCEAAALKEAVSQLDEELRIVIHLHYHCDFSLDMIADALNESIHTVKHLLYKAREQLAASMERRASGGDRW